MDEKIEDPEQDDQPYLIRKRPNFNHTTCGTLSYIAPEILGLIENEDEPQFVQESKETSNFQGQMKHKRNKTGG